MATIQKRPGRGGQVRYRVQIRLRGQVRSATFATWHEARHWAAVTEGTLRTQRGTPTREALYHTLGELLERYRRQVLPGKGPGTQAHQGPQLPAFRANNPPVHDRERARKSLPGAGLRADGGVRSAR
jgi:hypothetical protein